MDGTGETAVTVWVDRIASNADGIDVMFNAIGPRPIDADYATPSTTISYERFALPLNLIVGSQFLTARAAARHMVPRGRGAIVFLSASLTGQFVPFMSGTPPPAAPSRRSAERSRQNLALPAFE